LAVETEELEENLSQRHFVHHKSYMTWPVPRDGKPVTNRLSYGTASGQLKLVHNAEVLCIRVT
jgi:hypothetical protein